MKHLVLYWKPETVDELPADVVLHAAGSQQFNNERVQRGDIVWAMTSRRAEDLRLVARIDVATVTTSREEATRLNGGRPLWADAEHFVVGTPDGSRTKQEIDLSAVARRLVFESGRSRLPRGFSGQHLQSMRRLSSESGLFLERVWAAGRADAPPQFDWARDELILALDLYMRSGRLVLSRGHQEVLQLSRVLKRLPIHPDRHHDPTFRNPAGVVLKLANFRAIDRPGTGMSRGNQLERDVWNAFAHDPDRLRRVAQVITERATDEEAEAPSELSEDESSFEEGQLAFRLHRVRERDSRLARLKKQQVRERTGRLACEVCDFDFEARYGERGGGFIECHHTIALSDPAYGGETRLADLALVCANCHRMLHRSPWMDVAGLRAVLQQEQS